MQRRIPSLVARVASILAVASCGPGEAPAFPADYAATYTEVRDCRGPSADHQQEYVRVMASPDAVEAYLGRAVPFPVGAVLIKEQYGVTDRTCSKPIVDYSVMVNLAPGTDPAMLDWTWQHVSASRAVISEDVTKCVTCHSMCQMMGVGYLNTCEDP